MIEDLTFCSLDVECENVCAHTIKSVVFIQDNVWVVNTKPTVNYLKKKRTKQSTQPSFSCPVLVLTADLPPHQIPGQEAAQPPHTGH